MKRILAASVVTAVTASNAGVERVVKILVDAKANCERSAHDEDVVYASYKQSQCVHALTDSKAKLKEHRAAVERFKTEAANQAALAAKLRAQIEIKDSFVRTDEQKLKQITALRIEENNAYLKLKEELDASVSACGQVLDYLAKNAGLTQGVVKSQFVQLSPQAKSMVTNLMGGDPALPEGGQGQAYSAKAGGVIDIVKGLQTKFLAERHHAEQTEQERHGAFALAQKDLQTRLFDNRALIQDKSAKAGDAEAAAGAAEDNRASEQQLVDSEDKKVTDMTNECQTKEEEMDARKTLRSDELSAISGAIEVLTNIKQVTKPIEYQAGLLGESFLQMRTQYFRQSTRSAVAEAIKYLELEGLLQESEQLKFAAVALVDTEEEPASDAAGEPVNHLAPAIKTLTDYRVKLAASVDHYEQDHYCRNAVSLNQKEVKHGRKVTKQLKSQVDELRGVVSTCQTEIKQNDVALSENARQEKEAISIRSEERTTNEQSIADANEAAEGVAVALKILSDFYEGASKSADLSGTSETAGGMDAAYRGHGDARAEGGIMAQIETVGNDFRKASTETTTAENAAEQAHVIAMDDLRRDNERLDAINNRQENKRANAAKDLAQYTMDYNLEKDKYEKAKEMKQVLFDECDYQGEKQQRLKADREGKRDREVAAIDKALQILNKDHSSGL